MTEGGIARKGAVDVKFEIPGRAASEVGVERLSVGGGVGGGAKESDPFADDDSATEPRAEERRWEGMTARRKLVSGRYYAT
jgi:hypothetical protein